MKTWNDYKNHVKSIDLQNKKDMEEIENLAAIISSIVRQRNTLGITQRDLAAMCNIPQSSVARIESFKSTPKLDTLLKITHSLGLKVTVAPFAG